jgi:hypothetical protein
MSYIDAYLNKNSDTVHVVERVNGKRVYNDYPAQFMFYYDDPKGKHRTIYNTPVSRFSTKSSKLFQKELRTHRDKKLYESDLNPVFRCLEQNYQGQDSPDLHVAFFDIEVEMQPFRYPSGHKVKIRKKKK